MKNAGSAAIQNVVLKGYGNALDMFFSGFFTQTFHFYPEVFVNEGRKVYDLPTHHPHRCFKAKMPEIKSLPQSRIYLVGPDHF